MRCSAPSLILMLVACGTAPSVAPVNVARVVPAPTEQGVEAPICELSFQAHGVEVRRTLTEPPFATFNSADVRGALSARSILVGSARDDGVSLNVLFGPEALRTHRATRMSSVATLLINQPVVVEPDGAHVMRPTEEGLRDGELFVEPIEPIDAALDCDALGVGEARAAPSEERDPPEGDDMTLTIDGPVNVYATADGPVRLRIRAYDQDLVQNLGVTTLALGERFAKVRFRFGSLEIDGYVESSRLEHVALGESHGFGGLGLRGASSAEVCHVTEPAPLFWRHEDENHEVGVIDPEAEFHRDEQIGDTQTLWLLAYGLTLDRGALAITTSTPVECGSP